MDFGTGPIATENQFPCSRLVACLSVTRDYLLRVSHADGLQGFWIAFGGLRRSTSRPNARLAAIQTPRGRMDGPQDIRKWRWKCGCQFWSAWRRWNGASRHSTGQHTTPMVPHPNAVNRLQPLLHVSDLLHEWIFRVQRVSRAMITTGRSPQCNVHRIHLCSQCNRLNHSLQAAHCAPPPPPAPVSSEG